MNEIKAIINPKQSKRFKVVTDCTEVLTDDVNFFVGTYFTIKNLFKFKIRAISFANEEAAVDGIIKLQIVAARRGESNQNKYVITSEEA